MLIALAQFLIILTRGIDLSLGPVASVAASVMAITITGNPTLGIALPLLAGLGAGLLNGLLIVRLNLPPIIVTLATMSIWQGVALVLLPDPGGSVPAVYQAIFMGGFSSPAIGLVTLAAWTLAISWLLSSRFGLSLRAIGSDEQAAAMSGVRVKPVKIAAYALGGVLAAVSGMYLAIAMTSGSPVVGDGYILSSIAAVVIGGIPLVGGRGTPIAVVMGALILTITASLLYFAQVTSFYQSLINGLILLVVVGSPGTRDYVMGWCGDECSAAQRACRSAAKAAPRPVTSAAVPLFLLGLALALLLLGQILAPGFATSTNVLQLLKIASFLGLVALGQTLVMLVGGIDLSVAWVLTGSAVVFTALCSGQDANTAVAAAAALSVGLVAGFVNGFGIVKLKISPIVMTLAMNNIMLGLTLVYTGGTPSGGVSPVLRGLATGGVGGVPFMVIVWGVIVRLPSSPSAIRVGGGGYWPWARTRR